MCSEYGILCAGRDAVMRHIGLWAVILLLTAIPSAPAAEPANVAEHPTIRPSALAGTWYPASREELQKTVNDLLEKADPPKVEGRVAALIAPHAGYAFAGLGEASAFKSLKKGAFKTVVLMGPSHHFPVERCLIADVDAYETPLGRVALDKDVCRKLLARALFAADSAVHIPEHSLEIELPFLQTQLGDFKLVPILVGALRPDQYEDAARSLRECVPADALYVVSSDFTHYGASYDYIPFKENVRENLGRLDGAAMELILSKDFDGFAGYLRRTQSTICGQVAIGVLLKLLPAETTGTLLKYYRSGDLNQDWTNSVSYVSIAFTRSAPAKDALTVDEQQTLLRLARDTLEGHVRGVATPDVSKYDLTPALRRDGAAFVTLTINGDLRGCIGSLAAVEPLYRCIMRDAVNSSEDSRFPQAVQPSELGGIEIEISVLSEPKKVESLNDVVLGRDGLILEKHGQSAVFLPQVAVEQGWDRAETAENLCMKAGLPPDSWKEGAAFRVFTAQVLSEAQFSRRSKPHDWTQY